MTTSAQTPQREFLMALLDAAIKAADPAHCLPAHLPEPPKGKLIILGAGKAAGSMAAAAMAHYDNAGVPADKITGLSVTRHGYARPAGRLPVIEAGHPVPDMAGVGATQSVLALARDATEDDLVLVLLSGGGSANWIAPIDALSLEQKQALTRSLLKCGATISEINCIRRHISAIKGGRLAAAALPAPILTLAISDVPGDSPEAIASGPTVPDPSTLADARAILAKYGISDPAIDAALNDPANETPKPGSAPFAKAEYRLIARPAESIKAAAEVARAEGIEVVELGDSLEGEAWKLGAEQAKRAAESQKGPVVYLSGGEATVTVRGDGRGGPNQEFVLGAAIAMEGNPDLTVIAADTDGTDGGSGSASDPAGAIADGNTVARAKAAGLDPVAMLANNDSTSFFSALSDLLIPGPTYTNVNDFRAILFDPSTKGGN